LYYIALAADVLKYQQLHGEVLCSSTITLFVSQNSNFVSTFFDIRYGVRFGKILIKRIDSAVIRVLRADAYKIMLSACTRTDRLRQLFETKAFNVKNI
jgi:hypothetical protein